MPLRMSEEASSSTKTFAEKHAERMKRLKELHVKRVCIYNLYIMFTL